MQVSKLKTINDFSNAPAPEEGYYLRFVTKDISGNYVEYIKDHTGEVKILNAGSSGSSIDGIGLLMVEINSTMVTNNIATINDNYIFFSIKTSNGTIYSVEKDDCSNVSGQTLLNLNRYLTYDALTEFVDTWYAFGIKI